MQLFFNGPCKRSQHCWAQHVASVCTPCCVLLRVVATCWKMLGEVWNWSNFKANKCQHFYCFAVIEAWSNNVAFVCTAHPTILRRRTRTTNKEFNMAPEMENVNEELMEELTATKGRKKAASVGKDRGRARRWTEPEIDQLIDLLEEKDCLWDVNKKDYHLRNKRERAFEEMRDILDIDVAEIKAKIISLRAQLGPKTHMLWLVASVCTHRATRDNNVACCCERLHGP